jgi:hypothetical protein
MSITESKTIIQIFYFSRMTTSHAADAAQSRVSSAPLQAIFMSDPGVGKGYRGPVRRLRKACAPARPSTISMPVRHGAAPTLIDHPRDLDHENTSSLRD